MLRVTRHSAAIKVLVLVKGCSVGAKRYLRQTTSTESGNENGSVSKIYDLKAVKLGRTYRSSNLTLLFYG